MKKTYLLVVACLLGTLSFAQNYVPSNSTGTSLPYLYSNAGTAILAVPAQDVLSTWQSIPFPFSFYGQAVTGYYASDNGYITFDQAATTSYSANTSLPNAGGPNNAIYAFWSDFGVLAGTGSVDAVNKFTYGTAPNRVHVIQWYSVTPTSGTGFAYMTVRLYECGDFDIITNYGTASSTGTIGCENATGTMGAQIAGSPSIAFPSLDFDGNDDKVYTFHWDQINYDMAVTSISVPASVTIGTTSVTGVIANNTGSAISSFDLNYSVDGGTAQTMSLSGLNIPAYSNYNYTHSTPWNVTTGGATHNLCVWATNINGPNVDQVTCNDQKCKSVFVGTGVSGTRTILVEEFTGSWCGWCPDGAVVLENIIANNPGNVVGVSIHDNDAMAFAEGIRTAFNVTAYPNGMVDRKVFPGEPKESHSRGAWSTNTTSQIGSYTPADVTISHTYNPTTRVINLTVTGNFVDYANGDLRFVSMIVEDDVTGTGSGYNQVNYLNGTAGHPYQGAGDPIIGFVHQKVLRAVPGGAFGNAGIIPANPTPGNQFSETFTYTLPANFNENKINLVGFMAYYSTTIGQREVIDVAQMKLNAPGTSGLNEFTLVENMTIYPNPANEQINLDFELLTQGNARIIVADAYGKQVGIIADQKLNSGVQQMMFNTSELSSGMYYVSVTIEGKNTFTQRFTVSR